MILTKNNNNQVYLSVNGVHVYVSFLGPLLPEFRVIQGNVIAVLRGYKTGLREGGALALTLNGDGGGSSLKDLVDVLLTKTTALIILIHDGGIRSLPQKILYLLLRELLDLLKVKWKPIYSSVHNWKRETMGQSQYQHLWYNKESSACLCEAFPVFAMLHKFTLLSPQVCRGLIEFARTRLAYPVTHAKVHIDQPFSIAVKLR